MTRMLTYMFHLNSCVNVTHVSILMNFLQDFLLLRFFQVFISIVLEDKRMESMKISHSEGWYIYRSSTSS